MVTSHGVLGQGKVISHGVSGHGDITWSTGAR